MPGKKLQSHLVVYSTIYAKIPRIGKLWNERFYPDERYLAKYEHAI